jgi:pantothenate synthetase
MSINMIESEAVKMIQDADLKPEYFSLVNTKNLKAIENVNVAKIVAIVAAWAGEVRLIDNMIYDL